MAFSIICDKTVRKKQGNIFQNQCLKRLLGNSENSVNNIQRAYSNFPQEIKNFITPIDVADEDFIRSWLSIPYKYECPLQLSNGMIIYPDFTVLDVKRRKVWYWEHRG